MLLQQIEIRNFFGLESAVITVDSEDDRLQILVGPNGGGKSSVFKAIQFFVENFPKEGVVGTNALYFAQHKCWSLDKPSSMRLVFELPESERQAFQKWRMLGVLNFVRKVLKHISSHDKTSPDTTKHIESIIQEASQSFAPDIIEDIFNKIVKSETTMSEDTDVDDDDISSEGLHLDSHDQFQIESFWLSLENLLVSEERKFEENNDGSGNQLFRFKYVEYFLESFPNDRHAVHYWKPSWWSKKPPDRAPYSQPTSDKSIDHLNSSLINSIVNFCWDHIFAKFPENESNKGKYLKELEDLFTNFREPSADLHQHMSQYWHNLPIKEERGQMSISDDFIFTSRNLWRGWEKNAIVDIDPEEYQSMRRANREAQYISTKKKIQKTYYDGVNPADNRSRCNRVDCMYIEGIKTGKMFRSLKFSDPLLIRLSRKLSFPVLKQEVANFLGTMTKVCFRDDYKSIQLHERDGSFAMGLLLRTSLAWIQQNRSRHAATGIEAIHPAPYVLDRGNTVHVLQNLFQENSRNPVFTKISECLASIVDVNFEMASQGTSSIPFIIYPPNINGDSIPPVPYYRASGGQLECLQVLTAVFGIESNNIFLDEPGFNLQVQAQEKLLHRLLEVDHKRIFIITHSDRFIDKRIFRNLLIVSKPSVSVPFSSPSCQSLSSLAAWSTTTVHSHPVTSVVRRVTEILDSKIDDGDTEMLCMNPLRQLFFTRQVLIVEGSSDFKICQFLQRRFQTCMSDSGSEIMTWDIIEHSGIYLPLRAAICLGINVKVMMDIDKITEGFSECSQKIEKNPLAPPAKIYFSEKKIKELLSACHKDLEKGLEGLLKTYESGFERVFENADSDSTFDYASHCIREEIWNLTDGRVFILPRDLEAEVLQHEEAVKEVASALNNAEKKKMKRIKYVSIDQDHADIGYVLNLLHKMQKKLDDDIKKSNKKSKESLRDLQNIKKLLEDCRAQNRECAQCSAGEKECFSDELNAPSMHFADMVLRSLAVLREVEVQKVPLLTDCPGYSTACLYRILLLFEEIEAKLPDEAKRQSEEDTNSAHKGSFLLAKLKPVLTNLRAECRNELADLDMSCEEIDHQIKVILDYAGVLSESFDNIVSESFVSTSLPRRNLPVGRRKHKNIFQALHGGGWKVMTPSSMRNISSILAENVQYEEVDSSLFPDSMAKFIKNLVSP